MSIKLNKIALVVGAMVLGGSAMAATVDTGTVGVSATIAPACAVADSNTNLVFSPLVMLDFINADTSPSDSTIAGSFKAICTNGTTFPTFTYVSAHVSGSAFRLIGTNGVDTIDYTLYQSTDSMASPVTSNVAVAHPTFTANGIQQTLALSARIIPSAKNTKLVQAYTDTITITASFGV